MTENILPRVQIFSGCACEFPSFMWLIHHYYMMMKCLRDFSMALLRFSVA